MNFTLETLTPLHTGGIDAGKMNRIQETGIIGSLCWWYEAILRGLIGTKTDKQLDRICVPTGKSEHRCNYEENKRVCSVCDLFGATGWKRRFRLEISGGESLFTHEETIRIKAPNGKNGWFFSSPHISTKDHPISGQITLLREHHQFRTCKRVPQVRNDIKVIAELIARWGGLGPKTQHGYGVVGWKFNNEAPFDIESFLKDFPDNSASNDELPSLNNLFFARLYFNNDTPDDWWKNANLDTPAENPPFSQTTPYKGVREKGSEWRFDVAKNPFLSVPIAPAVRHKLRFGNGGKNSYLAAARGFENDVLGVISNPAVKSKINISNAYKGADGRWQFRLWGWLPNKTTEQDQKTRENLLAQLHHLVTADSDFWKSIFNVDRIDFAQSVWREKEKVTDSHSRNTGNLAETPDTSHKFLRSLLQS